jgi:hypothetical protein
MTEIIHIQATIERDGEVHLANLPVKRGQLVELSIRIAPAAESARGLTAQDLLTSDLIGMWQDRVDMDDSVTFARQLREQAQHRER